MPNFGHKQDFGKIPACEMGVDIKVFPIKITIIGLQQDITMMESI